MTPFFQFPSKQKLKLFHIPSPFMRFLENSPSQNPSFTIVSFPQPSFNPFSKFPQQYEPSAYFSLPQPCILPSLHFPEYLLRGFTPSQVPSPCGQSLLQLPSQTSPEESISLPQPSLRFSLQVPSQTNPTVYTMIPLPCFWPFSIAPKYTPFSSLWMLLRFMSGKYLFRSAMMFLMFGCQLKYSMCAWKVLSSCQSPWADSAGIYPQGVMNLEQGSRQQLGQFPILTYLALIRDCLCKSFEEFVDVLVNRQFGVSVHNSLGQVIRFAFIRFPNEIFADEMRHDEGGSKHTNFSVEAVASFGEERSVPQVHQRTNTNSAQLQAVVDELLLFELFSQAEWYEVGLLVEEEPQQLWFTD